MRILLALGLIALAAFPAEAANRSFGVSGFDRIRVDGPFRVRVTTGVAPSATATGSSAAIDAVAIDVQGRTLIVHPNRSSWGGYPGDSKGAVEIHITTHELTAAWLNGSGSLAIDKVRGLGFDLSVQGSGIVRIDGVEVDQLKVGVTGSGSSMLAGRALNMRAVVRGNSALDAAALTTKDAVIGADGPATVKATVTGSAKVEAQGVAAVEIAGNPSCTVKATGSATVSGCR